MLVLLELVQRLKRAACCRLGAGALLTQQRRVWELGPSRRVHSP